MSATFMEVLDTSVANVSLPHSAGSLSASTDEATWVLTSYLVSNAIILPATGWLSSFFGRKQLLITCIVIFTLSSALCGAATSLPMLIAARVLRHWRRRVAADRSGRVDGELPFREARAGDVHLRHWVSSSHRSSGRPWATGLLTITRGAGFFTSTSQSVSSQC
jgi:MFS family permease